MNDMKLISVKQLFVNFLLTATFCLLLSASLHAELLDRVVAVVDDEVIMLSEFNEAFQKALNSGFEVTQEEVLDGLINRILLLREAKKAKRTHIFSASTRRDDNILINEYIEKRVKAFIHIPLDEIELFYEKNKEFFLPQGEPEGRDNGNNFYDVRDQIESYLIEVEVNKRLINHIEKLRKKAYIRKQLRGTDSRRLFKFN